MSPKRDPKKPYRHDRFLGVTVVKLVPPWMTPNMITVFRFVATPFVLWLLLAGHPLSGVDLVLIGRDSTRKRDFRVLQDDLRKALERTGVA